MDAFSNVNTFGEAYPDDLVSFSPGIAEWIPQLAASIERHTAAVTLHPGQGLLLDNHRWLHARDTFEGPRRLYRLLGNPLPGLGMYPGIPVVAGQPHAPEAAVSGDSPA